MTDLPTPTPEQVVAALAGADATTSYALIDRWERTRSGNVFYRLTTEPGGREVVAKGGVDWSGSDAEAIFEAHSRLASTISAASIADAGVLVPITWLSSPPLLVMPYVEGTDVITILRDAGRPEWGSMSAWMRATGAMLATFHQANPADATSSTEDRIADLIDACRRMRVGDDVVTGILERAQWRQRCAAAYEDFGPGNLIGVTGGPVYLIDPPVDPITAPVHRDLGNFVFELRRQLAGHGYTRSEPVPGRFDGLRSSLLDGYSERAGDRLDADDEALIALYEMRRAAGMARKRLTQRPMEALWFARSARDRRREALASSQPR